MKRKLFGILILLTCVLLLAACGATVDTTLNLNEDGSGERVITLEFRDSSDLEKVTDGFDGIVSVAQAECPGELTMESHQEDGEYPQIIFHLSFDSIDAYRTKVSSLLQLGNVELEPSIQLEKDGGMFHSTFRFEENFDSSQLMMWLLNAVDEAGIVNHDDKNDWYSIGSSTLVVNGESYQTAKQISQNIEEKHYFSNVIISNRIEDDGTFTRTIELYAQDDMVEYFTDQKDVNLKNYLMDLCPDGVEFTGTTNYSRNCEVYAFTLNADSFNTLDAFANSLLQTDKIHTSLQIDSEDGSVGYARIGIQECYDASSYLSEYDDPMVNWKLYAGIQEDDDSQFNVDDDGNGYYFPTSLEEYEYSFLWKIPFGGATLKLSPDGDTKGVLTLEISAPANLDPSLIAGAFDSIKNKAKDYADIDDTESGCLLTISGTYEEISEKMCNIAGLNADFSINCRSINTGSAFSSGTEYEIFFNFEAMLDNVPVKVDTSEFSYVIGSAESNDSFGVVTVCTIEKNVGMIILAVVIGLLGVASIVVIIISGKDLIGLVRSCAEKIKTKKPAKPAVVSVPGTGFGPIQNTPDMSDDFNSHPTVVRKVPPQQPASSADDYDEEDLL